MNVTTLQKFDEDTLFDFAASNAPGTAIRIDLPDSSEKKASVSTSALRTRLLIAGFIDVDVGAKDDQGVTKVTARLPAYEKGTSILLNQQPSADTTSIWASAVSGSGAAPLIDEDALLENDGVKTNEDASGCGSKVVAGKRKPCKDCSCGLADMDGNAKALPTEPPKGGCGSCNLGDAFRCASCPYLGLPPFTAGEKVQVPSSLMSSDI